MPCASNGARTSVPKPAKSPVQGTNAPVTVSAALPRNSRNSAQISGVLFRTVKISHNDVLSPADTVLSISSKFYVIRPVADFILFA